jgi:hypothetical protein
MNALPWTIAISFAAAGLLMVLPRNTAKAARIVALLAALAGLAAAVCGTAALPGYGLNTLVHVPWLPQVGATFHLAADGITAVLTILTGIAATAGILFSWNIERRPREFFALYLALIGGVYGVFLSADVLLLFVFYEIAIVPKYFLIALWGSTNREYGAMKLALYSFAGSAFVLVGMLAAYAASGGAGFGLHELAGVEFSRGFQLWAFPLVAFGFAVLAGLWPFHTWAPTGHVAAPTAASMLLAGVVMKLGAYGVLRVAVPLFPEGFHAWSGIFAGLAVIGVIYGGFVALVQKDLKFVIGYSSVSHMGFVLLGLATPVDKLVRAERVGLGRFPGEIETPWPLGDRTDAILPVVTRDEIAARIAQNRRIQLPDELEHVLPESAGIGLAVTRLVQAAVDAAAQVLDESAEQARIGRSDGKVAVHERLSFQHGIVLIRLNSTDVFRPGRATAPSPGAGVSTDARAPTAPASRRPARSPGHSA